MKQNYRLWNFIFKGCPIGFIPRNGDVLGEGLEHGYSDSLGKCAKNCKDRSGCNSFAHSLSQNQCKLMAEEMPTTDHNYGDYQFCSKLSRYIIVGKYEPFAKHCVK